MMMTIASVFFQKVFNVGYKSEKRSPVEHHKKSQSKEQDALLYRVSRCERSNAIDHNKHVKNASVRLLTLTVNRSSYLLARRSQK